MWSQKATYTQVLGAGLYYVEWEKASHTLTHNIQQTGHGHAYATANDDIEFIIDR